MTGSWLAPAAQALAFQFTKALHQIFLGYNPLPIKIDALFSVTMDANNKWIAPFAWPIYINVISLMGAVDHGCWHTSRCAWGACLPLILANLSVLAD
jgi:hypothetical protein